MWLPKGHNQSSAACGVDYLCESQEKKAEAALDLADLGELVRRAPADQFGWQESQPIAPQFGAV